MLCICVYMHSHFVGNQPIQILEDGPLISEVVLSQACSRGCGIQAPSNQSAASRRWSVHA
jgi:hypothetical protein